ncbi:MAG: cell division protein FtsQ/DivIB [Cyanobacteriota bacterium]
MTTIPALEQRRQIRRQQRQRERLRNLWRLLVFTAIATGAGYALLRHGWMLTGPQQVELVGSRQVSREQLIQAAGLRFPVSLLALQPRSLASQLGTALPVEQVQITRLMAPPRLRFALVDRQPVARAQRLTGQGPESGFVDRLGNWMSSRQTGGLAAGRPLTLTVLGWQPRHRAVLALVLEQRETLGPELQDIRFDPNGSLWLRSSSLGLVRLGPPDAQLPRRLAVLRHLSRELPGRVKGQPVQSIDLSDPDQPELGLPAPAKGASASNRPAGQPGGRD